MSEARGAPSQPWPHAEGFTRDRVIHCAALRGMHATATQGKWRRRPAERIADAPGADARQPSLELRIKQASACGAKSLRRRSAGGGIAECLAQGQICT
jgi:hypothetical protein